MLQGKFANSDVSKLNSNKEINNKNIYNSNKKSTISILNKI